MKRRQKMMSSKTAVKTTDYSELVKKITPVGEIPTRITAVFYGKSGTGKTTLASTFPKPILFLDIREQGEDSISDAGPDVHSLRITDADELEQIYWYLTSSKHPYKTVVIDTVTQMQDIYLKKVMELEGKKEGDFTTKQTWGTVSSKMKTWIISFRDLEEVENIVFLAQPRTTTDDSDDREDEITPSVGPRTMPSVADVLCPAVKIVGNTYIQEVTERNPKNKLVSRTEYRLRIGPHAYYITKIKKPKTFNTPDYIVDPSYNKLIEVIRGNWNPHDDKPKKKKKKG